MKQIIRKILFYLFTAWAALTINFIVPRLMPGDPVQSLMTRYQGNLSTDAIQSLTVLFGLDKETSLWEQYVTYFQQVFRGDLGLSFTFFPSPVISIVAQSLPWTIALVGIASYLLCPWLSNWNVSGMEARNVGRFADSADHFLFFGALFLDWASCNCTTRSSMAYLSCVRWI